MIRAQDILESFSALHAVPEQPAARLRCKGAWLAGRGSGVTIGLLDSDIDLRLPDLADADLTVRHFAGTSAAGPGMSEHGTHSAALLAGQGHQSIQGIAPGIRLLIADVLGPRGSADRAAVEAALSWLLLAGAEIVAMPMGAQDEYPEVARSIARQAEAGVLFLAAAGNAHPAPVSFPARHPAVVAVGAADHAGRILPDCCRWPRLDMLAPGKAVPAPVGAGRVRGANGSSVACVVAAGAAALALAQDRRLPRQGRAALLNALTEQAHHPN